MDPSSTDDECSSDSCSSCSDAAAEICTVCQGYLDVEGETTCTLGGCGHRFHANCIVHALQYNRACPNCRYAPSTAVDNVDPDDSEDEEEEDVEAREAAQALARRRTSAIRSTLARARFGRVAPEIQKAIKQYRAFTGKVAAAVTERAHTMRTRRKCKQAFRGVFEREYKRYEREDRRICTQLRAINGKLQCAQAQKESLGDLLASAGGFVPPEVVD